MIRACPGGFSGLFQLGKSDLYPMRSRAASPPPRSGCWVLCVLLLFKFHFQPLCFISLSMQHKCLLVAFFSNKFFDRCAAYTLWCRTPRLIRSTFMFFYLIFFFESLKVLYLSACVIICFLCKSTWDYAPSGVALFFWFVTGIT